MFCPNCGEKVNNDSAEFCSSCGAKLKKIMDAASEDVIKQSEVEKIKDKNFENLSPNIQQGETYPSQKKDFLNKENLKIVGIVFGVVILLGVAIFVKAKTGIGYKGNKAKQVNDSNEVQLPIEEENAGYDAPKEITQEEVGKSAVIEKTSMTEGEYTGVICDDYWVLYLQLEKVITYSDEITATSITTDKILFGDSMQDRFSKYVGDRVVLQGEVFDYRDTEIMFDGEPKIISYEKTDNMEELSNREYIFPNSSSEILTVGQLSKLSEDELRLARNEIYARHGYIFKSDDLKEYFSAKSWYKPKYDSDQEVYNILNEVEKENLDIIKQLEQ